jgi:GT2 family glycosyltransferase
VIALSVIVAASRSRALAACIDGLVRQTVPPDSVELIVVHGPGFEMPAVPRPLIARTIEMMEPHPAAMRNTGAQIACGGVLAFLDDDAVPPPGWAAAALELVPPAGCIVAGGPNRDGRSNWRFRLAQAIQEHPLLEGLVSHRAAERLRDVGIHDLPLCNLVVPKALFERLGGLSSATSYFLDDVDFNARAKAAGARLVLSPDLSIHHDLRPLIWPYLEYKFHTRYMIGRLLCERPDLYADAWQLRLIQLAWWMAVPLVVAVWRWPALAVTLISAYLVVVLVCFGSKLRDPLVAVCGVPALLAVHVATFAGYTGGRFVTWWRRA